MGFDILLCLAVAWYLTSNTTQDIIFKLTGQDPPSFRRQEARRQERAKERAARRERRTKSPTRKFLAHEWEEALNDARAHRDRRRTKKRQKRDEKWAAEDSADATTGGASEAPEPPEAPRPAADQAPETSSGRGSAPGEQPAPTWRPWPAETTAEEPSKPSRPSPEPPREPQRPRQQPQEPALPQWTGDRWGNWPPNGESLDGFPPAAPFQDADPTTVQQAPEETGGARIIPMTRPDRPAVTPATTTNGGTVTAPVVPTEFTGYEATVAGWEAIQRLCAQLDAAYEQQIAALRTLNVDARTLTMIAHAREANDQHANAARAAHNDWVKRHGTVREAKAATGATGDQAVYEN